MNKVYLIVITLICVFGSLHAQDIIITKDAQKIEAKVLEVSKSEIKYKKQSNLEGPTFVIGVEELNSIIYANGEVQLFNNQKEQVAEDLSIQQDQIIYKAEDFKGGELPKMTYKKVLLPNGKTKFRYVGGNLVFTEIQFLKFCKKYCVEVYVNFGFGLLSQGLMIYNINCAGTITEK